MAKSIHIHVNQKGYGKVAKVNDGTKQTIASAERELKSALKAAMQKADKVCDEAKGVDDRRYQLSSNIYRELQGMVGDI
jgi:ferritin-like protein